MNSIKNVFLIALLGMTVGANIYAKKGNQPNIVLLYIDDWAWNGSPVAMNVQMPNSKMPIAQMPNVEQLAKEGMVFQNAYGSPQCSPARACVQTGQTSARTGFTVYMNGSKDGDGYYDNNPLYEGFKAIGCVADYTVDPKNVFIPEALQPLGYATAHIGKWHLRSDPGEHGYDVHDGDMDNNPGNTLGFGIPKGTPKPRRLTEENMQDPKLMFSVTEKSIKFMEEQVKAKKPFYLQISHYAMHEGRECKIETREKYVKYPKVQAWYEANNTSADEINRKSDPAVWLGMADDLDGRIGAVLEKIKDLGIEENTYVIMVSDNGYRHEFYPDDAQPLHGKKWWVWEGGIRVPMIIKGPGIKKGSAFKPNVVNYDFLPTFVEWAGGRPEEIEGIDGVSIAPYLMGNKPSDEFLNRNLYFHYPHYRESAPMTAVVSGNHKVLHFWEYPDVPMLFDLSKDIGEVSNISGTNSEVHKKIHGEMMTYLKDAGAKIPKLNPDFDPYKYARAKGYQYRLDWGPFLGDRNLDNDEYTPNAKSSEKEGDTPEISLVNIEEGMKLDKGDDLLVKVDVKDKDGLKSIDLYVNGLFINPPGKTYIPNYWDGFGDPYLKALEPGVYNIEVIAHDNAGNEAKKTCSIKVGSDEEIAQANKLGDVLDIILTSGDKMTISRSVHFIHSKCDLRLGKGGVLIVDKERGKIFECAGVKKGDAFATIEDGKFKIYSGKTNKPKRVLFESDNKINKNKDYKLGITKAHKLALFSDDGNKITVVWTSK